VNQHAERLGNRLQSLREAEGAMRPSTPS
jgi:hypothetical protein